MNLWLILVLLGVVAVIGGGVAAAISFGRHQNVLMKELLERP